MLFGQFYSKLDWMRQTFAALAAATLMLFAADWKTLFDGKTLNGWMWSTAPNPPEPSWAVRDGALVTTPGHGKEVYLLTKDSFSDFELEFEWKGEAGVNSGIKYRFQGFWSGEPPNGRVSQQPDEGAGRIEPIALEYQIADDTANKDALSDAKHACASLYEYWPATKDGPARPGVWPNPPHVVRDEPDMRPPPPSCAAEPSDTTVPPHKLPHFVRDERDIGPGPGPIAGVDELARRADVHVGRRVAVAGQRG